MVEFVSANPTGPLHVGHGRQGALGDALAALLESQGYEVTREFYYNDAGVQIATIWLCSVQCARTRLETGRCRLACTTLTTVITSPILPPIFSPSKTRRSPRIRKPVTASGDPGGSRFAIREFCRGTYLRHEQDIDLQTFGIHFRQLLPGIFTVCATARWMRLSIRFKHAGKTYEDGGALWLRTTDYGDDKDRVMIKSDGTYTYFVPDVAYHINKWQRGFEKVINVQGSDHHGTIARVRAGLQASGVGVPTGYPDYVLHKMVTVMKDGAEVKISKRAGSYVTVRDLIEWSGGGKTVRGRDAVRFFLISRKADTEFVFGR